jgi:hypothetical protein
LESQNHLGGDLLHGSTRALLPFGKSQSWALLEGGGGSPRIRPDHFPEDTCRVIKEEASKHGLPESFFARLIWKESLFDPSAVSPKGAEGIAQFIPSTAVERGLADSFDVATALTASAHFLSDLEGDFGSLGLAAAAYNAGPTRVQNWLAGASTLPLETQEYVHAITGHTAEDWVEQKDKLRPLPISDDLPFDAACRKLATRELRARTHHSGREFRKQRRRQDLPQVKRERQKQFARRGVSR